MTWWWIAFNLFVIAMLALDLGIFNKKPHVVTIREALVWTCLWVVLALLFNLGVYFYMGSEKGLEFLTGYLIEKSLSVDNVFVFSVIFTFFGVPRQYQHKVLFWGIFGALIMRALMIFAGVSIINRFSWSIYIFALILVVTGIKLLIEKEQEIHPEKNPAFRLLRRLVPISKEYHGHRFFIRQDGRLMATPLFAVLICIEFTDLIFAVDSIPAIFAISRDAFIIYTSNIFAILGLRSLYFAFAGILHYFHYLKYGLGIVLCFVGVKMALAHTTWEIGTKTSLTIIASVLVLSVIASLVFPEKKDAHSETQ